MNQRSRRYKSATLVAASLILVLASFGVAYAAFTDQVRLMDAQVKTGEMHSIWMPSPIACSDSEGTPGLATTSAVRDAGDEQQINFSITNGYPGYWGYCSFQFKNVGTLPVKITSLDINGVEIDTMSPTPYDLNGDSVDDVVITFSNGVNSVYQPGLGGSKSLQVEILGGAPSGATMTFSGHVNFALP